MENTRDFELIQKYFDKTLTESEKAEVEYRLKEDPNMKQLHAEHQKLVLGVRYGHLTDKLAQLKSLESALPPDTNQNQFFLEARKWIPYSIAAAVIISLGTWFLLNRDSRPVNEKLFTAYFEPFDSPGRGLTRGSDDANKTKSQAYAAYDAGEYATAIELFRQQLQVTDDPIMHLCMGNAMLAIGETKQAESTFRHILDEHNDLVTQAKWYLSLTYLKEENLEKARATLWEISKSSTYGEKARKLLDQLD